MTHRLVILGASNDGKLVAAAAAAGADLVVHGFLDDALERDHAVLGLPVLGKLTDWTGLPPDTVFLPALHKVGDIAARSALVKGLGIPRERWATVVHPQSFVATDVELGCGVFVGSFATIQPGTRVGDFVSVRPGANVGCGATLGDFAFISANVSMAGCSSVGECAHVGMNASIRDYVEVGEFAIVGMGAVITKPVAAHSVVVGNPARPLMAGNRDGARATGR